MKTSMIKFVLLTAAVLTSGGAVLAQDASPAKLWQELESILPRRSGIGPGAPIGTPSAAIDWTKAVTKAEELMVRAGGTPVEPFAMYYLANFYFDAGRLDEAKAIFETLRSQFSTHPMVTAQLAKDGKSVVTQAIEDCATELAWRQRHPRGAVPTPVLDPGTTAVLHFSTGDVKIQFYKNIAPKHFENFVKRVKDGDYTDAKIGQVIQDSIVTVGETAQAVTKPEERGKPTIPESKYPPVPHEFANLSHTRGMVAMTRNMTSNESNGLTFQVVLKDQPYFDFTQTIFARVVDGIEVVDAISRQARQAPGAPSEIVLKSVTIEPK